jgi:hypothetical protein
MGTKLVMLKQYFLLLVRIGGMNLLKHQAIYIVD